MVRAHRPQWTRAHAHGRSGQKPRSGRRPLRCSDYVIDESCTLAKARAGSVAAIRLLDLVEGTRALDMEWVGSERFEKAKKRLRKCRDQGLSFTDCASFEIMRELDITEAITNDEHFRIAGFEMLPGG